MVDSEIQTHIVETATYFVVTGFQKGIRMVNQYSAQGKAVLKIFKLKADGSGLENIHSIEMNNENFKYINYKNFKPTSTNGNSVYYVVVNNQREARVVSKELWKYDLKAEQAEQLHGIREVDMPAAPDGSPMFAAQVMFSATQDGV